MHKPGQSSSLNAMSLDKALLEEAVAYVDMAMVGTFREATVRNALAAELASRLPESEIIMEVAMPIMFRTSTGSSCRIGTHIADILVRTAGIESIIELKVNTRANAELQVQGYKTNFGAAKAFVVVFYYIADAEVTEVN